jgi:putative salt-induced outer membrane protein YdiY
MSRSVVSSAVACALVLACMPVCTGAQVNIERMRQKTPEEGVSLRASAGLSSRTGNVDATNLDVGAFVQYHRGRGTTLLAVQGDYGWQGGEQFSNQGLAHLRYTRWLDGTFALEAFVQSDYNKARLLDARALAGAGLRAAVIDGERVGIDAGTSYMFEVEEVDVPAGAEHPDRTEVSRWSSYVGLRWKMSDNASLSATGYVQPQIDEFDDVRVISSGALDTKLGGAFTLTVSYSIRHDSEPPDDIESTDTQVGTQLGVSF